MKAIRRIVRVQDKPSVLAVLVCSQNEVNFLIDALDAFAKQFPLKVRRPKVNFGDIRETLVEASYGKLPT